MPSRCFHQPAGGQRTEGQADAKGGAQQAEGAARAAPWNSGASEDMAAAKAAAPPVPWTSRSTSIQKTDGASGSRKVAAQNSASPSSQTRRGPIRSTRLPATMMTLP